MADRTCLINDCGGRARSRGLCDRHYNKARWAGTIADYPLSGHWSASENRDEVGAKISAAKKGKPFSVAHREALSRAHTGKTWAPGQLENWLASQPKTHKTGPLTEKMRLHLIKARAAKGPTRLELALRTLLDELGVAFVEQFPIGNHTVDAFVPRIGLVIEADGAYWHQSKAKDRARDAYLSRNPLVRDVVHLTEKQLAPWTPTDRWSKVYRVAA